MIKSVMIIGPDFYNYNLSVSTAFKKMGYKVKIVSYVDNFVTRIDRVIYNVLPKYRINFFKKKYIDKFNKRIYENFNIINPNIVFVIKGNYIYEKTLEDMKEVKKILWLMDSIKTVNLSNEIIKHYDHTYYFEKSDKVFLDEIENKSTFLPLGFDEGIYFPTGEDKKEIDIIFIGTLYKNRRQLLEKLVEKFHEFNIQIYGKYTTIKDIKTIYNYYFKGYRRYFKNKNIKPRDANIFYNKSKIALNIHHFQSNFGCNPRVFEILGTKTFQLVDNNEFVSTILNDDEIISYCNETDLFSKIKIYLEDEIARSKISNMGYENVIQNHKFIDRIRIILSETL